MEEVIKLINDYWTFDNNQRHTHTWHDKQDLLEEIGKLELYSRANMERAYNFFRYRGFPHGGSGMKVEFEDFLETINSDLK